MICLSISPIKNWKKTIKHRPDEKLNSNSKLQKNVQKERENIREKLFCVNKKNEKSEKKLKNTRLKNNSNKTVNMEPKQFFVE